jgi:hypothetical protein
MSTTDIDYILANRRWLHAKSIMSYVQVGLSSVVILALAMVSFLGASSLGSQIKGFEGSEKIGKLFVTFFGSFAIALIALFALSIAIYYYTAVQYKKIAVASDELTAKSQLKPSEKAVQEYQSYFKTVGILNIVSWTLGGIILVFLIGSFFVALASSGVVDKSYNYDFGSSSSSYSSNTDYSN